MSAGPLQLSKLTIEGRSVQDVPRRCAKLCPQRALPCILLVACARHTKVVCVHHLPSTSGLLQARVAHGGHKVLLVRASSPAERAHDLDDQAATHPPHSRGECRSRNRQLARCAGHAARAAVNEIKVRPGVARVVSRQEAEPRASEQDIVLHVPHKGVDPVRLLLLHHPQGAHPKADIGTARFVIAPAQRQLRPKGTLQVSSRVLATGGGASRRMLGAVEGI
eukprot:scaffold49569_cov69-Phaeocystis_antarctica.AAC.6